ncbi:hypothetical protein H0H87_008863 [Tephrocybe sp. NHM501043]|nr:hypothetical protein H0H87_008863 [Tephrocybe sp. NHM501043]
MNDLGDWVTKARKSWPSTEDIHKTFEDHDLETLPVHQILFTTVQRMELGSGTINLMSNFQMAAFHLNFLLRGFDDIPANRDTLIECLGLPADYSGRVMPAWDFKGPLLVCLFVTPLMLLAPFKLTKKNPSLPDLILYWQNQGQHQKPASVVAAERYIIQALFDIARKGVRSFASIDRCLSNLGKIEFSDTADWRYTPLSPVSPYPAISYYYGSAHPPASPNPSPSTSGVVQAAERQVLRWVDRGPLVGQPEASEQRAENEEDRMEEEVPVSGPRTEAATDKDNMPVEAASACPPLQEDVRMLVDEQGLNADEEPRRTDREGDDPRNASTTDMDVDEETAGPRRAEEEEHDSGDSSRGAKEKEGVSIVDDNAMDDKDEDPTENEDPSRRENEDPTDRDDEDPTDRDDEDPTDRDDEDPTDRDDEDPTDRDDEDPTDRDDEDPTDRDDEDPTDRDDEDPTDRDDEDPTDRDDEDPTDRDDEDPTDRDDEDDDIMTPIRAPGREKRKGKKPQNRGRKGRATLARQKPNPRAPAEEALRTPKKKPPRSPATQAVTPQKLPRTVEVRPSSVEDHPGPVVEDWGSTGLPKLSLDAYTPLMTGSTTLDIPGAESIKIQAHHKSQLEFLASIIQAERTTKEYITSKVKVFQDEQMMTRKDWQCYRTHSLHILGSRTTDIASQEERVRRFEAEVRKMRYGDLSQRFEVQDFSIDLSDDDRQGQYREATLRQLVEITQQKEGKAVNALDIPGTKDTFDYPELSSERVAWDLMSDHKEEYPVAAMRWWLASTGWTHHTIHQDCDGLGTIIHVKTGMKIWMIVTPKSDAVDPGSIHRLFRKFQLDRVDSDEFHVEMVVLRPGDKLFLRPRTLHAVITPEPSVVLGGHLYSTLTIRETVWGIYDDFVAGEYLTNSEHRKASLALLGRLVNLWYDNLVKGLPSDRNGVVRRPVISNRKRARQLLEWFFCTYQVLDRDTGIEYDRGRVENTFVANQARALLDYKELAEQTADVHGSITITHKQLKATLRKTLGRKPDGQNFYDDACKTGTFHQFYWPYVIRARDVALPMRSLILGETPKH